MAKRNPPSYDAGDGTAVLEDASQAERETPATGGPRAGMEAQPGQTVALMATPIGDTIAQLPIGDIFESPFNSRVTYRGMAELQANVAANGVLQPVLVRPLRHRHTNDIVGYELVFGHRRYRAAKAAGLATLPAMFQEMSDSEARRKQQIENIQREDLDPIDEAEGFKAYIESEGIKPQDMAKQIGKSRTHVYNRLKLITLLDAGRNLVRDGTIGAEIGTEIARLPTVAMQRKALGEIAHTVTHEDGSMHWEVMSHRDAVAHIDRHYARHLSKAIFDRVDIALVADAPACAGCERRLGNMEEGASAARADICTSADCFDAKTAAHLRNVAAKAALQGGEVVQGLEAKKLLDWDGKSLRRHSTDLVELTCSLGQGSVREALGKKLKPADVVHVVNPDTGAVYEAVRQDTLVKHKLMDAPAPQPTAAEKAQAQREYQEANAQARRSREVAQLLQSRQAELLLTMTKGVPRTPADLVFIAWHQLQFIMEAERFHEWLAIGWPAIASQFKPGWATGDLVQAREHVLYTWLRGLEADALAQACMAFVLLAAVDESPDDVGSLPDLARAYGIDPDKMARDAEAEVDAEEA